MPTCRPRTRSSAWGDDTPARRMRCRDNCAGSSARASLQGMAVKRNATYADIEALPENVVGEIVAGELNVSPRPSPAHGHAQTALTTWVNSRFGRDGGGPGGWRFIVEPELHLHGDILVPDVAGWKVDRTPP